MAFLVLPLAHLEQVGYASEFPGHLGARGIGASPEDGGEFPAQIGQDFWHLAHGERGAESFLPGRV